MRPANDADRSDEKLIIVIDTSAIYNDPLMKGDVATKVRENLDLVGGTVEIPSVVLDELRDKHEERLLAAQRQVRQTRAKFAQYLRDSVVSEIQDANIKDLVDELDRGVRKVATVSAYPDVAHHDVMRQMLAGKKPFKSKQSQRDSGKKEIGYKDFLLWRSVVDAALEVDGRVALITENTTDFADEDDKSVLHADLVEDLESAGGDGTEVTLYTSLHDFYEREILPELERLEDVRRDLQDGSHPVVDVGAFLTRLLPEYIRGLEAEDLSLPHYCEGEFYSQGWDVTSFNVTDVRKGSGDNFYVDLDADAEIEVDFFIHKSDVFSLDLDDGIYISEPNWNEHYVSASKMLRIGMSVSLTLDEASSDVSSYEVVNLEVL